MVELADRPNGTYVYRGELENDYGVTELEPLTVEVTDAAPARPVLRNMDWDGDGGLTLEANLWWGTNADAWELRRDGEAIASGTLVPATPAAQHVEIPVTGLAVGHTRLRDRVLEPRGRDGVEADHGDGEALVRRPHAVQAGVFRSGERPVPDPARRASATVDRVCG